MGIKLFSSGSGNCCNEPIGPNTSTKPNPNPFRFSLKHIYISEKFILLIINYLDATTYNGDKILVYKKEDQNDVLDMIKQNKIDPHFLDDQLSPIARFPSSDEGFKIAMKFINYKGGFNE